MASATNMLDLVQLESLIEIAGDSPGQFMAEIASLYYEQSEVTLQCLLKTFEENGEHTELAAQAHKLKGSSSNIGIRQTALICEKLEKQATELDHDQLRSLLKNIEITYWDSRQQLADFIAALDCADPV